MSDTTTHPSAAALSTKSEVKLFQLFSNNPSLSEYPHLQESLFIYSDDLTRVALSCTCTRYRSLANRERRKTMRITSLKFHVRHPEKVWVLHPCARFRKGEKDEKPKVEAMGMWKEADEEDLKTVVHQGKFRCYAFEKWLKPSYISSEVWFNDDENWYLNVKTSGGAVLSKSWEERDSIYRPHTAAVEIWSLPKKEEKEMLFTLRDIRDLYIGRYKGTAKKEDSDKVYSKFWKEDPEIYFCSHIRGWLPCNGGPENLFDWMMSNPQGFGMGVFGGLF